MPSKIKLSEARKINKSAQELYDSMSINSDRVQSLLTTYLYLKKEKIEPRINEVPNEYHVDDLLRATVVLLHSILEDFLRTSAIMTWKDQEFILKGNIPLIGSYDSKKFHLGDLISHNGKSVRSLIRESIESYVYSSLTFNNSSQIVSHLEKCGIFNEKIVPILPEIDNFLKRRHKIVHHSDLSKPKNNGRRKLSRISIKTVISWWKSVAKLMVLTAEAYVEKIKEMK